MTTPQRTADGWSTRISLPTDAEGFFGRRCPDFECGAFFKVQVEEYQAAREAGQLSCPTCGATASDASFHTSEQKQRIEAGLQEFAQGVLDAAIRDVFGHAPSTRRSPGMTITYKPPPERFPGALPSYVERATIRSFTCSTKGRRVVTYDLVSFCPYCGSDTPPRPIFDENMAAMTRLLDLIDQMPEEARRDIEAAGGATAQIERALGGAGAALQHLATQLHEKAGKTVGRDRNPWQNPDRLAKEWRRCFSNDPLASLTSDDQRSLRVGFARRHVLEHNGGRVDQKYLDATGDNGLVGRRLRIRAQSVREFFAAVVRFADNLGAGARDVGSATSSETVGEDGTNTA
ncbi:MAG: hypothetical protein M3406_05075 [Chloroflexota bacterium]|nr:hypothetical protein [Chloroflexota bacterium]